MPRSYRTVVALFTAAVFAGCAGATQTTPPAGTPAEISEASLSLPAARNHATDTFIKIPTSNSIQTDLISTIPTGTFVAHNTFKTKFHIPANPKTCGYDKNSACNFYDAFTESGNSITIKVSLPHVDQVYTLMNAYSPPVGQEIATIKFIGDKGAKETFKLVAGQNIRDFYQGTFANTLKNHVKGVVAKNAFTCDDPSNCLGAGGSGDVNDGEQGTYHADEQQYTLSSAFAMQTLTRIVITQGDTSGTPLLLGITAHERAGK